MKYGCENQRDNLLLIATCTPTSQGLGLPLLLEGEPGTGKTAIIAQWAKRCGLRHQYLSPATHGPGMFGVLPAFDIAKSDAGEEKKVISFPPHAWVMEMNKSKRGLVLIDELKASDPIVRPGLLGAFAERRFGDTRLSPGIVVWGATNSAEHSGGSDLTTAANNRFVRIDWRTTSDEEREAWLSYMRTPLRARCTGYGSTIDLAAADAALIDRRNIDGAPPTADTPTAFDRALHVLVDVWEAFSRTGGVSVHKMPEHSDAEAWESRRSWELALAGMATARVLFPETWISDARQIAVGAVGEAGNSFVDYIRNLDIPDAASVLDGKETFEQTPPIGVAILFSHALATEMARRAHAAGGLAKVPSDQLGRYIRSAAAMIVGDSNGSVGYPDVIAHKHISVWNGSLLGWVMGQPKEVRDAYESVSRMYAATSNVS